MILTSIKIFAIPLIPKSATMTSKLVFYQWEEIAADVYRWFKQANNKVG